MIFLALIGLAPPRSIAADKTAKQGDSWKRQKRLNDRINEATNEVSLTDCALASVSGGYGPACDAAAKRAESTIDRIRDWKDEAEDLTPPDKNFHSTWLRHIQCQLDLLKLERDEARLYQINALERGTEIARRTIEKLKECGSIGGDLNARAKALGHYHPPE